MEIADQTQVILLATGVHAIPLSGGSATSVAVPVPLVVKDDIKPNLFRMGGEYFLPLRGNREIRDIISIS